MMELIFRFTVDGLVVSFFSVIGDVLKPKSFAALVGAATSVALATLGLTIIDFSALKTRWYEYVLRFFFGGAVTVTTGLINKYYVRVFGGLFLAFPAIFPASGMLVEKHETEKK